MNNSYVVCRSFDEYGNPIEPVVSFLKSEEADKYVAQRENILGKPFSQYNIIAIPFFDKCPDTRIIFVKNITFNMVRLYKSYADNRVKADTYEEYMTAWNKNKDISIIYDKVLENNDENIILLENRPMARILEEVDDGLTLLGGGREDKLFIKADMSPNKSHVFFTICGFDEKEIENETNKIIEKYKDLNPENYSTSFNDHIK